MKKHVTILLLLFIMPSCIEILDDIKFNIDGSGTFKYTVNLSSSQVKLNSILALDSLDGKKVPSLPEIQEKMEEDHELLKKFEINGLKIIKSGLHVGEESINNSSMTSRFIRPSNASHKKYLGIILDLTHFETETSLDGSEIIKIFRDNINTPPKS